MLTEEQKIANKAEASRRWRAKHKDTPEYRAMKCQKQKEYVARHKEQVASANKKYQANLSEEQREKRKQKKRDFYQKNIERLRAEQTERNNQRKEYLSEYYKNDIKLNPEKYKVKRKKRYEENKDKEYAYYREWVLKNPDKVKAQAKRSREKNRDKCNLASKEWRKENPEKQKASTQNWINNNREKWRAKKRAYQVRRGRAIHKERYKNDPQYCLRRKLQAMLRSSLKRNSVKKNAKTVELLGCSLLDFQLHLESLFSEGMSWENKNLWEIDHKRPIATYDLTDLNQQKQCFHFSNLQPLWKHENRDKRDRLDWIRSENPLPPRQFQQPISVPCVT